MNNNDRSSIRPPPAQYNPKQWLNDEDFCIQVGRSMFQSLAILGLWTRSMKLKLKSTINNLPANIILTRMILQSLVSPHLKLLLSSSS